MTQTKSTWKYLFNNPLECGVRVASLLLEVYPATLSLQRLVEYEYLMLHSADVDGGPASLHPATPYRAGELLVRRELLRHGLEFMMNKGVVIQTFPATGVSYGAGESATAFLDALSSQYARRLRDRAAWVASRFASYGDEDLTALIQGQWPYWGTEFTFEALAREGGE